MKENEAFQFFARQNATAKMASVGDIFNDEELLKQAYVRQGLINAKNIIKAPIVGLIKKIKGHREVRKAIKERTKGIADQEKGKAFIAKGQKRYREGGGTDKHLSGEIPSKGGTSLKDNASLQKALNWVKKNKGITAGVGTGSVGSALLAGGKDEKKKITLSI